MAGKTLKLTESLAETPEQGSGKVLTPVNVVSPEGVLVPTPELPCDRRSRGFGVDILNQETSKYSV